MFIQALLGVLLSFSQAALDVRFDLYDVSVLLPLPPVDAVDRLPGPLSDAQFGPLLPKAIYDQLPPLTVENKETIWKDLRLVGFRVDPCFAEGLGPFKCRAQVRMVWQPVRVKTFERDGVTQKYVGADDAAMHTFYELNRDEFEVLLSKMVGMKKRSGQAKDRPLLVHPVLAKEGLTGPYFKELWNLVLAFTGENRMSRVTFMQVSAGENMWVFGGFDLASGKLVEMEIPRVSKMKSQAFLNNSLPRPFWFNGGIFPEPQDEENLNILTRDSRKLTQADEESVIAAVKAAVRFENPNKHNPGTVDCVSCHVAQAARIWSMRQFPWLMLDQVHKDEFFVFNRDLTNTSPMQPHTNVVRAFGYFENRPIVAQRTINESAAVIDYLEKNFTNESK